ncbi:unnamed protein product [Bemisia tabaci]|uniref:Aquaporin 3 n=1 Tax=Bemisia tabaci TaxID=7038 RepID=A0A1I9WA78_BEMTA|nr:PREDICTED: aquaporin AQPAe.a [Bemisia tabaci]XP_018913508.1 PREDICTED: aquaporin AQPAe.a [Bemisia tabaci]APA28758.1 aquaporin 3 [Bemisia tabaci]CAH0393354.1 unnamed protein product [Bemisia tabaci]
MAASLKNRLGVQEVTDVKSGLGKALVAEALGTLFINFFGCLSAVNLVEPQAAPNLVLIALTFGFIVFVAVQSVGHVSGAHINPAITVGLLVTGKVTIIRAFLYIVVQVLGAIAGSAILRALTPSSYDGGFGVNKLANNLTPIQGLGIEFILGFILVLVVFGVCDANRQHTQTIAALTIGLTVAAGHLATIDFTGTGMNPARSFGAAVIESFWENHWVFWVGPILGGIAASLLYTYTLAAPAAGEYSPVNVEEKELKSVETANN